MIANEVPTGGAGREFLDFNAGIAVSGLGHADPDWYKALVEAGKVRLRRVARAITG